MNDLLADRDMIEARAQLTNLIETWEFEHDAGQSGQWVAEFGTGLSDRLDELVAARASIRAIGRLCLSVLPSSDSFDLAYRLLQLTGPVT